MPKKREPQVESGRSPTARTGKRQIAGWFTSDVAVQLKQIGLKNDEASVQDLLREALNDLFVKHGKKPIA